MTDSETMLGLAEPLQRIVSRKFTTAFNARDVIFSPTSLAHLRAKGGASFQLRYCPALKKKPQGDNSASEKKSTGSQFDPFADPAPELLIARIPNPKPTHALVLNKYPVIHNHFIIATEANKPQTDILEEDDVGLAYACLRAWEDQDQKNGSSRLFAFFNSGEHSGASQVHRHLQFLPVEDVASSATPEWDLLIDGMTVRAHPELALFHDPSIPISHFSTPLEKGMSPADLHRKYVLLMRAALSSAQSPGQPLKEDLVIQRNGKTLLSYNLGMTTDRMAICPRSQEAAAIPGAGPESSVPVNGTVLAGTLMVKDEDEWITLQGNHALLDGMLTSIGYPLASWQKSGVKI
ncbi:bifunctional AP-4-A phosphorylase/ADP sulfurylase [Cladophialophora chaetospira]|uniref:Bifunctional AP-4-A phosphorylase/ADP sulfurylase n=1 Tax=Cladophialophora chaetospira TaxID=386627 RepID=A0AA38XLY6_9EURO|nr:bifunctional AP-4-A phosphorylase/ADP sulfurylase [Cladophialophora chaetospira]